MLPVEIWDIILKKIESPVELLRLQLVSRVWCDLIEKILPSRERVWKKLCELDIPLLWVQNYLKSKHPNLLSLIYYSNNIPLSCFKDMYVSWKLWQIAESPRLKFINNERITCIAVREDIVAFGTSMGVIYVSHIGNPKNPFYVAHQNKPVSAIKFWIYFDENKSKSITTVVSACFNGNIRYWNIIDRTMIRSCGLLGRLVATTRDSNEKFIVVYNNIITESAHTENPSVIQPKWIYPMLIDSKEEILSIEPLPQRKIHNIMWYNENIVLTLTHDHIKIYILKVTEFKTYCTIARYKLLPTRIISCNPKKFYCFAAKIVFCAADHLLAYFINDRAWKIYNTLHLLGGKVTSLTLEMYNSRLAIGLDSGAVYVYHIENSIDLDLTTAPKAIWIPDDNNPILFLENSKVEGHYYIVAATANNIYAKKIEEINDFR